MNLLYFKDGDGNLRDSYGRIIIPKYPTEEDYQRLKRQMEVWKYEQETKHNKAVSYD